MCCCMRLSIYSARGSRCARPGGGSRHTAGLILSGFRSLLHDLCSVILIRYFNRLRSISKLEMKRLSGFYQAFVRSLAVVNLSSNAAAIVPSTDSRASAVSLCSTMNAPW